MKHLIKTIKYICPWTGKNTKEYQSKSAIQSSREKKKKKTFEHNHPKSHSVAMVTEKKAKEKIKKTVN
jgi:hypothetical protein